MKNHNNPEFYGMLYRKVFEEALDAIFIADPETGRLVECNRAACELTGREREELIGMHQINLHPPEEHSEEFSRTFKEHISSSDSHTLETKIVTKKGEIRNVAIKANLFEIEGKRYIQGIFRDITSIKLTEKELRQAHDQLEKRVKERTEELADANMGLREEIDKRLQANEALKKSEQIFRMTFENAAIGMANTDPSGRFTHVNEALCRMVGYERDEFITKTFPEITHPDDRKRDMVAYNSFLEGTIDTYHTEKRYLHKNGSIVWISLNVTAIRDNRGKIQQFVTQIQDITERKKAEEALNHQKAFVEAVLNNIEDGIVACDENGMLTLFNRATRNFHGIAEEGLPPEKWAERYDLFMPDSVTLMKKEDIPLYRAFMGEEVRNAEMVIAPKDGRIRTLLASGNAMYDVSGRKIGAVVSMHDMTGMKKAEEEKHQLEIRLLQSQKMETIGTLAGGIAHDFNNILQPMLSSCELLEDQLSKDNPVMTDVKRLKSSALRAKELVRQILTFSRQAEAKRKTIKIQPIIDESLKLLRSSIPATVEIRQWIDESCGPVTANATQMQQVVMNLCTNAAHAIKGEGTIEVSLVEIEADEALLKRQYNMRPGRYLRLTVKDTGHGMSEKTMERIFDPFFTTKEIGRGTGLGLSVVHGIVMSHGGDIEVMSEVGKGSTVKVYLPAADGGVEEETATEGEAGSAAGMESILFVDDEEDIVVTVKRILERAGYRVTAETDSIGALERFSAAPAGYDLIITDYSMPNMGGAALIKEMKRIRPDIRIILCSGLSEAIDPVEAKRNGANMILSKPFVVSDLKEAIRTVLDKK